MTSSAHGTVSGIESDRGVSVMDGEALVSVENLKFKYI